MTLNDIKKEIAALGFESEGSVSADWVFSVRRALEEAYREYGVHAEAVIYQNNPTPDFHIGALTHAAGDGVAFSFVGGAYCFKVDGVGTLCVSDESGEREYAFHGGTASFSGCLDGEATLTFIGDFRYTVYDLCHFSELTEASADALRYGRLTEYDLERRIPDYLTVCDVVRDGTGEEIKGCSVCSGVLSVPYGYAGEIRVRYCKRAPSVSADFADEELDVPPALAPLIPLLCAFYVWLDDDAEKAQYYLSRYREGMSVLKLYSRGCLDTKYTDIARWT